MQNVPRNQGLIRMAFWVVIGVLVLSYLGFDLKTFIESDQTQGNLRFLWDLVLWLWGTILEPIWSKFISPVWNYFWGFIGPTLENFGEGSLNPFSESSDSAPNIEF